MPTYIQEVYLEKPPVQVISNWAEVITEVADTLHLIDSGMYTEASLYSKLDNLLSQMKTQR